MPTRLLREGILTSERLNKLTVEEEVFYRRLMSKVDDHGLFDARPAILRASLYPLRLESTTESNCEQWLFACINAELLMLYQVHGKPFLKMLDTKWKVRSEPKYDLPVNGCKQLKAPVTLDVVVDVVRSRLIEVVSSPVDNSVDNFLDQVNLYEWAKTRDIKSTSKETALEFRDRLKAEYLKTA